MNYQNSIPPTTWRKFPVRVAIIIGVIGTIAAGILGIFLLNKNTSSPQFIDDKGKEQIQRTSIPGSTEIKKDGISFSYPSDYKLNDLEENYYVVFNESTSIPSEAGINIDARRTGTNSNYDQALQDGRNYLLEPQEKEILNGVKMYGTIKEGLGEGIPTLFVFLKYGDGAIKIEHSGEILNEAVFDQVVNSIKIN